MAHGRLMRLVAETDHQVVGNGQLSLWQRLGEIGSLVVAAPYRRRGIGDSLLSALIEYGEDRGLAAIELEADLEKAWLQQWYRRRGFQPIGQKTLPGNEQVVVLHMSLAVANGRR
jgi:N-acetylglutamate synthase-like GNAT family acetyltransferase